ncbi:DUF5615 family PIN-like protein [Roseovarius sp. THAF27]|uniref:DUF5615 family PIN-like protein n=1 Tax=Roseovarius sp. THAF27 TaxID=2587850 RepID=UPI0015626D8C|nr:DUF5615 family PIN-like protein [Roseovarius sp. THAF27]
MRFMLDENVPMSAKNYLMGTAHDVEFIRDLIPEGSVDPLVAFVAEDKQAVLVSHDGDFQKIAPRIPDGQKTRFKGLSRIWLRCNEFQSAQRLEKAMTLIEAEFLLAQASKDARMQIWISNSYIRTER